MRTFETRQKAIVLDAKDYTTLGNAVTLLQNILDEMEEGGYSYCAIGDEGEEWSPTSLEGIIGDLRMLYDVGDIRLH